MAQETCSNCKVKIKCTLVQALRLCTGRTAHTESRGIALLLLYHGTRRGWGVSVTPRPLFTLGKDPVPIVQKAGWAPEPVCIGAENLVPTGIRSPDRLARSQSLYRLSYPVHTVTVRKVKIWLRTSWIRRQMQPEETDWVAFHGLPRYCLANAKMSR